jgi:hypothetical protein
MESNKVADDIKMKLLGRVRCEFCGKEQKLTKLAPNHNGETWVWNHICKYCLAVMLIPEEVATVYPHKET